MYQFSIKKIFVSVSGLFLLCSILYSRDEFLFTALNISSSRNKKLLAKKEEIELSKRQLWAATRTFFPSLLAQRRYSRGKTLTDEYQGEDLALRMYQPIYDGGRIRASHNYYSMVLEDSKLNYTKLKEELIYSVKVSYYEYLSSLMEVKEFESLVNSINQYYKKLENEFKAKAISEMELEEGGIFKQKIENMYEKAKLNKSLFENKLIFLIGVKDLGEIIFPIPVEKFSEVPKEIDFDFESLKSLVLVNSLDLKKIKLALNMAKEKEKMVVGRTYPKFYLEGSYGQSGEAYVKEPLQLTTVWSGMLRLGWMFGGSSLESSYQKDQTVPRTIVDLSNRIDSSVLDTKLSLFDDMKYFMEKKEAEVLLLSTQGEFEEVKMALLLELEKYYNEYRYTLLDANAASRELKFRKWRLDVLKKRNSLLEVPTVEVMNGIFQVSESVLAYSKAVLQNYSAVSALEKFVLIPLR
ncbi:MAG: TolC family protein, partial [Endomicrobiia bacterium]